MKNENNDVANGQAAIAAKVSANVYPLADTLLLIPLNSRYECTSFFVVCTAYFVILLSKFHAVYNQSYNNWRVGNNFQFAIYNSCKKS